MSNLSGELLLRLVQCTETGIVVTDAQRVDNPIIFANNAFYNMTGYGPEETIGFNCRFLQGADSEQAGINSIRSAVVKRESCKVVLRNYRKNGSMFWNELYVTPFFDQTTNQLAHFIGIQNDITAAVEQKMQKEMFNAGIIHDIKGPLLGQARILEYLTGPTASNFDALSVQKVMLDSLKKSMKIVSESLTYYKLENDIVAPQMTTFSAKRVIERVIETVKPAASIKKINLVTTDGAEEIYFTADEEMACRALKNLVENAINYSPESKNVWILASVTENISMLAVIDEGPGMPENWQSALDQEGDRIKSGFVGSNRQSTSLGLMTCSQIMRIHGGLLKLLKSDSKGTEVALVFPLQAMNLKHEVAREF